MKKEWEIFIKKNRDIETYNQIQDFFEDKIIKMEIEETENKIGKITIPEIPFNITFNWSGNVIKITLVNGEDLLKIAMLLSELMTKNGIENKIEKITI